ncbi:hypothetical protein [Pontibacter fetidus]|uniref:STAS/SEC14 domain-containing protein n=1 Tax=Pontibacter fetidus TaxID=2700082 RepID=A0A6B2GXX7_9BACT|nr:hypothetical protein [Pontibacter fetidus]NDK54841.1 hypothetical protein [Pontibacter fetidus]
MYSANMHSTHVNNCEQIAQNSYYDLKIDKAKNRIYFTIHGFWKNKEAVSSFISDWEKCVSLSTSGFTILTDMTSMITHPQELNELHMAAQKMVIDAGVKQVANVLPSDKIANLQANSFTNNSSLPFRNFANCQEAEAWLNQVTTPFIT